MFRRLFLLTAISFLALPAVADTITVIPPNPAASTPIVLHVSAVSGSSSGGFFHGFSVVGQVVRVEGCTLGGFSVPSAYQFDVNIGALNQGTYSIEYWVANCEVTGTPSFILSTTLGLVVAADTPAASIVVTQVSNGHIVANLSTMLEQNCLGNVTTLDPLSPPGYFDLSTNVLCSPPSPPVLYTYAVDLGIVADGDYTIFWGFIAGGFGPVGGSVSQPFSVRNGILVSAILITPQAGLWWNPDESGSGYAIDIQHGVVVVTVYSYNPDGTAQWYLMAGPLSNNKASGPLQKFKSGQCIYCTYKAPVADGSGGTMTVAFTSATRASVTVNGGRNFTIVTPSY